MESHDEFGERIRRARQDGAVASRVGVAAPNTASADAAVDVAGMGGNAGGRRGIWTTRRLLDAADRTGDDPAWIDFFDKRRLAADGLHPTQDGYATLSGVACVQTSCLARWSGSFRPGPDAESYVSLLDNCRQILAAVSGQSLCLELQPPPSRFGQRGPKPDAQRELLAIRLGSPGADDLRAR